MIRKSILLGLISLATCSVMAQKQSFFTNPVIHGDMADPSIIRVGETYYATGTSSEWAPHYPIFSSKDLVNWTQEGHVFEEKPAWIKNSFWAPEWFVHQGKTYVYYTARKVKDNISCIGVAVADSPVGPFKDYGPVVEFGKEAIDAFILEDKGNLYISWKAYGLDNRPIELLACKLSKDGLRMEGEPFSLLRDDEHQGLEGQHWFKQGDYYYIIYSIRSCCGPGSDYAVSVARSKKLQGPYEKYVGNPILEGSDEILSIGHGTLTTTPEGKTYYLAHAYLPETGFYQGRQPFLLEMKMGGDQWPSFVTGKYARITQPTPALGIVQEPVADFYDSFAGKQICPEWTWNFPFADVEASLQNGQLMLGGSPKEGVKTGVAYCLRPTGSDYTLETAFTNQAKHWQGITLYGDSENLVTWGISKNHLAIKLVKNGKEEILSEGLFIAPNLHLRMTVSDGCYCTFYWSKDGKTWNPAYMNGLSRLNLQALVRWDRIARPGLYHEGTDGQTSAFAYCSLRNEQ